MWCSVTTATSASFLRHVGVSVTVVDYRRKLLVQVHNMAAQ